MGNVGFYQTSFQRDAWLARAEATIVNNAWFAEGAGLCIQVGENECPTGANITVPIIYSQTNNVEVMASYDSAMPASSSMAGSSFYFTKTAYQGAAMTWKMLQQLEKGFGSGGSGLTPVQSVVSDDAAKQLVVDQMAATMSTALAAELEAQVDSSGTYGDGAAVKATYDLLSYEDTSGGYLTLYKVETMIDNLCSDTYGSMTDPPTQMDLVMARNQARIFSRAGAASAGVSFSETNFMMMVNSQSAEPIDAGRLTRTKAFEGIRITIAPFTNSIVLGLRRGTNYLYNWWPLDVEEKTAGIMGAAKAWHFIKGSNFVCHRPKANGKISGLTTA